MAGRKSDFTLPTNTLDDLFSTQEERDDAKLAKIRDIPLTEIDNFPDHPFMTLLLDLTHRPRALRSSTARICRKMLWTRRSISLMIFAVRSISVRTVRTTPILPM